MYNCTTYLTIFFVTFEFEHYTFLTQIKYNIHSFVYLTLNDSSPFTYKKKFTNSNSNTVLKGSSKEFKYLKVIIIIFIIHYLAHFILVAITIEKIYSAYFPSSYFILFIFKKIKFYCLPYCYKTIYICWTGIWINLDKNKIYI